MTYELMTYVPDVLTQAGVQVVEHSGWRSRALPGGSFEPRYVVWHHDASAPGDSPGVPAYMIRNFAAAAAQVWVDRAGVWHLIAAGRAPHAGNVLPGKPGNAHSIGIETDHTTGEDWPGEQIRSLCLGTAALLKRWGTDESHLEFHATVCDPPGRKIDPAGMDLDTMRQAVRAYMGSAPNPPAPPPPKPAAPPPVDKPDVYLSKLRYGQRDSDSVRALQAVLRAHIAPTLPVTGNYLTLTDQAVRDDQRRHGASWGEGAADAPQHSNVGPKQAAHLFGGAYDIRP